MINQVCKQAEACEFSLAQEVTAVQILHQSNDDTLQNIL